MSPNYKTVILRKEDQESNGTGSGSRHVRTGTSESGKGNDGSGPQDVQTVKELVGRVGEKNLKSLIELVG